MSTAPGTERNFAENARNTGKPTTNILDRIKEASKKGASGVIRKVEITRAIAWDLLILNINNRPVKLKTVEEYSAAMLMGEWMYTSESIVAIDANGALYDSQHRLLAVVQSGVTIIMDIITGYEPEGFKVLNRGRNRTPGDLLALEGFTDYNKAANAASFIIGIQRYNQVLTGRVKKISPQEIVAWTRDEKNKKRLNECVETADELFKHGRWLGHNLYAGMLFLLGTYRRADAEEFMMRLATGSDISAENNSPIYYLRKVLEKWDKIGAKVSKLTGNEMKIRYIITAWNFYVQKDAKGRCMKITAIKLDKEDIDIPKIRRA